MSAKIKLATTQAASIHLFQPFLQLCHHLFLGVHFIQQSLKLMGNVILKTGQVVFY